MLVEFFWHTRLRMRVWAFFGLASFLLDARYKSWWQVWWNGWYGRFMDLGGLAATTIAAAEWQGAESHDNQTAMIDLYNKTGMAHVTFEEGKSVVWSLQVELFVVCMARWLSGPIFEYIRNRWLLSWRLCLIDRYLVAWDVDNQIENAAQRVHEDTTKFCKGLQQVVMVLVRSFMTLLAFVPMTVQIGAQTAPPAGLEYLGRMWLLAIIFATAFGGIGVSVVMGKPLVGLEVENQKVEADLRKKLVLLETSPSMVMGAEPAASDGDDDEEEARAGEWGGGFDTREEHEAERGLLEAFALEMRGLLTNYRRLYRAFCCFQVWLALWNVSVWVLPYMMCGALLFDTDPRRRITIGTLSRVGNAFHTTFDCLVVLTDNWGAVVDFLSTLRRLQQWESALRQAALPGNGRRRRRRSRRARATGAHALPRAEAVDVDSPRLEAFTVPVGLEEDSPVGKANGVASGKGRKV